MAASGMCMVLLAGGLAGGCNAPLKLIRRFGFEHWSLIAAATGQVALPWAATWALCPGLGGALAALDGTALATANLLSAAWGVANVLYGLCLLRIGFSLAMGLLTGIGLPIGVLLPLLLRGSGDFADAPGLGSASGAAIAGGTALMLAAVALFALAGRRREPAPAAGGGAFRVGMAMAAGAGVLQAGLGLAFVYAQGPIAAALRAAGAGEAGAGIGVWAVTLPGGAAVCIGYALWLLLRRRSWRVLAGSPRDWLASLAIGLLFFLFVAALGAGMRWLGALGGSIGFGLYQAAQLGTAQAVGLLAGEWSGAPADARRRLRIAIALAMLAVGAIACGRWLAPVAPSAGAGATHAPA